MKKALSALIIIAFTSLPAFAADPANIKIKINGAIHDNSYFLCLQGVGCLSILAAKKGKIYPVFHAIQMDNIFVNDAYHGLRLSPQGLPNSCNVTVAANQTITIYGTLMQKADKSVVIKQLHCSVS